MRHPLCLLFLLAGLAALPCSAADVASTAPEHLSIFLVDQEASFRLLPGSTRFEESILRQSNLTERAARRRYPGGPIGSCLSEAFESLRALCNAEPAPLELDEDETGTEKTETREIELPSTFRRPEPASVAEQEDERRELLPAPKPPPRSLRCALDAFDQALAGELEKHASEAEVSSLYVSLLLTTRLPPARADKREYWRLHGRSDDYTEQATAGGNVADAQPGRDPGLGEERSHEVALGGFEREIRGFDDAPALLRLQLRGEAPDGHVKLLAGRLLARIPRSGEDAFDARRACSIDRDALLEMLRR